MLIRAYWSPSLLTPFSLLQCGFDLSIDLGKKRGVSEKNEDFHFHRGGYCLAQYFGTALLNGKNDFCDFLLERTGKSLRDIEKFITTEPGLIQLKNTTFIQNFLLRQCPVTCLEYLLRNDYKFGDISPYWNDNNILSWAYNGTVSKKLKLLLVFGGSFSMPFNPSIAAVLEKHESKPSLIGGDNWTDDMFNLMQFAIAVGYYNKIREPELATTLYSLASITWKQDMITWLTQHTEGPVPLKFRSRQVIRLCCGSDLVKKVQQLPLPKQLQEYMLLLDNLSSSDDSIRDFTRSMLWDCYTRESIIFCSRYFIKIRQ